MTTKEFWARESQLVEELHAIPGYQEWYNSCRASRRNKITYGVNCKVPAEELSLENAFEEAYYEYLWKTAEAHEECFGRWPVFEMEEIESDDPCLDIYNNKE